MNVNRSVSSTSKQKPCSQGWYITMHYNSFNLVNMCCAIFNTCAFILNIHLLHIFNSDIRLFVPHGKLFHCASCSPLFFNSR